MKKAHEETRMKPIWYWVGLVLCIYGLIISGMGVYYVFYPETLTKLHKLNPSLWWGSVIFLTGAIFFYVSLKQKPED